MKTFAWHVLILGGFYFIISLLSFFPENSVLNIINLAGGIIFALMFFILCFKKKYNFTSRFQNKFTKTSIYLAAFGIGEYFSIIFITIPGIIYGYKLAMAQYNGEEIPLAPIDYLNNIYYIYLTVSCFSLIWATYKSFVKK